MTPTNKETEMTGFQSPLHIKCLKITLRNLEPAGFDWIAFYSELAVRLLSYRDRQSELINFLLELRSEGLVGISVEDRDERGNPVPLVEIDGFTFFAHFNRGISLEKRIAILRKVKERFQIEAHVPLDFSGVPLANNQSTWFFSFSHPKDPRRRSNTLAGFFGSIRSGSAIQSRFSAGV